MCEASFFPKQSAQNTRGKGKEQLLLVGTRTGGQEEDQLHAERTVGHSEVIGTLTEKPEGFAHGFTRSLHSSLCSSVGDAHKALHLKPVLGRDVFLTIPFRAAWMPWGSWFLGLAAQLSQWRVVAVPWDGGPCLHGGAIERAESLLVSQPACRGGDPSAGRAWCSSCCCWG